MEELDFTKPPPAAAPSPSPSPAPAAPLPKTAASQFYDREIAAKIFKAFGRAETLAAETTIFAQDQKASGGGLFSRGSESRMYYLVSGQVAIVAGGRQIDSLGEGDVFGEGAVITERPRTASAIAKTACSVYSLNVEELTTAIGRMPEFAMMLMSVMFDRIRFATARLTARRIAITPRAGVPPVFDAELLASLEAALPRSAVARYRQQDVIMREGQSGAYMYVVKTGKVAIGVQNHLVDIVLAGGTFGEMALVDQSPRSATAIAEAECELLSIDRASLLAAFKARPAFAFAMMRDCTDRVRHLTSLLG
jgi:CRP/FNR family cyclic AMP-dependent transcriptional regulator